MNKVQQLSRKILAERLKLQLGLAPDAEVDYDILRAMSRQLRVENLMKKKGAARAVAQKNIRKAA